MIDWINQVWKNYIFSLGFQFNSLLILDYASSHLKEEVQLSLINLDVECAFIPKGLTSILQPLDVSINKPMKDALKKKYTEYCIESNHNINNKVSRDKIMNWICEVWYDEEIITKQMIEKSLIITGISNYLNNPKEFRDIKVYKWIKEKYVIKEDDEIKDNEEYVEIED